MNKHGRTAFPGRLRRPGKAVLHLGRIAAGLVFAGAVSLVVATTLLGSARAAEAKSPRSVTVNFGEPTLEPKSPDSKKDGDKKSAPPASPGPEKRPPEASAQTKTTLSPQLAALRDRVRAVVVQHFHDPLNTNDNPPRRSSSSAWRSGATPRSATAARLETR